MEARFSSPAADLVNGIGVQVFMISAFKVASSP